MTLTLAEAQERRRDRVLQQELDERLDNAIALGAKDVGPHARYKLRSLLKYYAKKPHPFTSCVRDNEKRFGRESAERICATLKDIIRGTTKWRKGGGHKKKLSDAPAVDGETLEALELLSESDLWAILGGYQLQALEDEEQLEEAEKEEVDMDLASEEEIEQLLSEWTPVFELDEGQIVLSEFFLEDERKQEFAGSDPAKDGVWKTVLRTGTWKMSPGPGQKPIDKPLHVILSGKPRKGVIVLEELLRNFKERAKEHVTIPKTHEDNVLENTGTVKDLRIIRESDGNARMDALHVFTDQDALKGVLDGSVLNCSVGVLYDYVRKSDGKIFPQVLGHVALTNSPWIDGMEPFGVAASEDESIGRHFSLVLDEKGSGQIPHALSGGGDMDKDREEAERKAKEKADAEAAAAAAAEEKPTVVESTASAMLSEVIEKTGLSAEEILERLDRSATVEQNLRRRDIDDTCKAWLSEGVPPAVVEEAKLMKLADDGGPALLLSETVDGKKHEEKLSASEIVDRIVSKVPRIKEDAEGVATVVTHLSEGEKPDEDTGKELSLEERAAAARKELGLSEDQLVGSIR